MPISWTLVWFGVLGPQNKAPNLGVSLEIKLEQQSQCSPSYVSNKYYFVFYQQRKFGIKDLKTFDQLNLFYFDQIYQIINLILEIQYNLMVKNHII